MADGEVVFNVRVDTSQVIKDMAALRLSVAAGMASLTALTSAMAVTMGNAIANSVNMARMNITAMCTVMTAGTATAAANMNRLAVSVAAAGARLAAICALNTASIIPMLDKLNSLSTAKLTSTATAIRAVTSSLRSYIATAAAANAVQLKLGTASTSTAKKTSVLSAGVSAVSKKVSKATKLRSGKEYVPYDGYPALLHKGEAVLTAGENEALRGIGGASGIAGLAAAKQQPVSVENKIEVNGGTPPPQNINLSVELDGYQVAKAVGKATNELTRQLNARVIKQ